MRDPLAELNSGLIDQSTFDALKVTSPHLFRDSSPLPNIPKGPQPGIDSLTGLPVDTVQIPLGTDLARAWKDSLLFGSTGSIGGNTLAQDIDAGNIGAGSSPEALGFLKGAIAGMPRYIRGVPAPSGVINKAPHIDSPYIDEQIRRGWKPIQLTAPGPQLPGFV